MAAEDSAELSRRAAQVLVRILVADIEAALAAGSHRFGRTIYPNGFNSRRPEQVKKYAAAAPDIEHRRRAAKKFHEARLDLAHHIFTAAEFIQADWLHGFQTAPYELKSCGEVNIAGREAGEVGAFSLCNAVL
jgi:hypothetical protein